MNKCAFVLGAVAIATLAGCKDPDYKYGNEQGAQNQVKPVEATPAPAAQQPIAIETVSAAKCTCPPGTKHTSPCMCGAPDCRCVVVPQKVIVADVKPAPEAPAAAAAEATTYIVQRGDSLSKISKKYNIRVDAIRKANPKIKNDVIRIGQKLTLPAKVDVGVQTVPAGAIAKTPAKAAKKPYAPYTGATKEYVVKNGDTLGGVAYANGLSIRQLKELNGLSANGLRVGQKLKVPAAGKAAKTAVAPKAEAAKVPETAKAPEAAPAAVAPAAEAKPVVAEKAPEVGVPPATETKTEAAPAPQPAKQPEVQTTTYVVQDGDDMTGISIRYAVSAARIRELNNLGDDAQLLPGQILKIPVENQQ